MPNVISFADKAGNTYYNWPAGPSFARLRVALTSPAFDRMIDTTHSSVAGVLGTSARKIAGYVTGSSDIAWTATDFGHFGKGWGVVRIDQSRGINPLGDVKDVEPGASTIAEAVVWARAKHALGQPATVYLAEFISGYSLAECRAAMAAAGIKGVTYWVANWGLSEQQAVLHLGGDIVAWQWASPTSNGRTMLPGTLRTLTQVNADLSVTVPSWFSAAAPPPPPPVPIHPSGTLNADLSLVVNKAGSGGVWDVHGTLGTPKFGTKEKWFCVEAAVCVGGKRHGEWIHVSRPANHITPERLH